MRASQCVQRFSSSARHTTHESSPSCASEHRRHECDAEPRRSAHAPRVSRLLLTARGRRVAPPVLVLPSRLSLYTGSKEDALKGARADVDQHLIHWTPHLRHSAQRRRRSPELPDRRRCSFARAHPYKPINAASAAQHRRLVRRDLSATVTPTDNILRASFHATTLTVPSSTPSRKDSATSSRIRLRWTLL